VNDFFKNVRFKILLSILIVLVGFMLRAAWTGGLSPMLEQIAGIATTPARQLTAHISSSVSNFLDKFLRANEIYNENQVLKAKVQELNTKLVDYEKYKQENEQYKDFLGIKEENPDFDFEPASVIGRDPNDQFGSFTIDKGSLHGVSLHDPVINKDGLIGYVSNVGLTFSKVKTLLDVTMKIGAFDSRTKDTSIVQGDIELSLKNYCKMSYLERETGILVGDLIVTSGIGGIYPKGLIIGEISEIKTESHGTTLFAVIKPAADVRNAKDVVIITSFLGQNSGLNDEQLDGTLPEAMPYSSSSQPASSSR